MFQKGRCFKSHGIYCTVIKILKLKLSVILVNIFFNFFYQIIAISFHNHIIITKSNLKLYILYSYFFQNRTVKSSIFKITGSIPSANYIQFPRPKSPPLNLVGHYLYVLFKPIDGKFFSIHLDVVATDNLVIRISLSNIFKEFKSSLTWLQFPVSANPVQGSVDQATTFGTTGKVLILFIILDKLSLKIIQLTFYENYMENRHEFGCNILVNYVKS